MAAYPKVAQLKTVDAFRARLAELQLELPVEDRPLSAADGSPLAEPLEVSDGRKRFVVGNRWCIHPMEGWDAKRDGSPSELTLRRWRNFGLSGAKLIWGGEAAAVQEDGRANPNQTLATEGNRSGLRDLIYALETAHVESFGSTDDLLVGLQLTHSGRFCKPKDHKRFEPRIAYHHPLLDSRVGIAADDDSRIWTDSDLERLIDQYLAAAQLALDAGYQFVDIKACHGYLLHEFLSARTRPGKFGGDFEGRTRVLTTIIRLIRSELPELLVGVRLSAFDTLPYKPGSDGIGEPPEYRHLLPYYYGFGASEDDPTQVDLAEPIKLLKLMKELGVFAVNLSGGSPYYNPHVQRPAIFPPSDGYQPPEDPLVGVVRQIQIARQLKEAVPGLLTVGTAYSYLQDYLPHVAQGIVRQGWADFVGLGRMVLSYPELPAEVLDGRDWQRKKVCRTFSDCTTAPRNGLASGCYPLDPFYKERPEAERLAEIKKGDQLKIMRCEEGYLCDICGKDVENIWESDLYLRYVIGLIDPETLHTTKERHIVCNPALAQFIVDPEFPAVIVSNDFRKELLDREFVSERESLVTRGWRRLKELATLEGLSILEYPLPEVRERMQKN